MLNAWGGENLDRFGVFVDAGYLLMAAGAGCLSAKQRAEVSCDYPAVTKALCDFAESSCTLPILRLYWYDAAPDGVHLAEHLAIGRTRDVKVRLGRIIKGNQKGVDSLIVRDLIVLAQTKALTTAYLLSGDEDLREGVREAQDEGVRVVLLGIPPTSQSANQSDALIREADEHIILGFSFFAPFLTKATLAAPLAKKQVAASASKEELENALHLGRDFATGWLSQATDDDWNGLMQMYPKVTYEMVTEMTVFAEQTLGALHGRDDVKTHLRTGFRAIINKKRTQISGD